MRKQKIIEAIQDESKIHHNISINWSKMPDYTEADNFRWEEISSYMQYDFMEMWQQEEMNDTGNRNLCGCNKIICTKNDFKKDNGFNGRHYIDRISKWINLKEAKEMKLLDKRTSETNDFTTDGACKKHDLWHIYSAGRSGATLYWNKYWDSMNSGFFFRLEDYKLEEKPVDKLKDILKEMQYFNKCVRELMQNFYAECIGKLKESQLKIAREKKIEKEYQAIKNKVEKRQLIKRLVADLI